MKIIFAVFCTSLLVIGYGRSLAQPEELMVGKWDFDNIRREDEAEPVSRLLMELVVGKNSFKHFFRDHRFVSYDNEKYGHGTWRFSADHSKLIMITRQGNVFAYTVAKLTEDTVIFYIKNKYLTLLKANEAPESYSEVQQKELPVKNARATTAQITKKWILSAAEYPSGTASRMDSIMFNALKGSWFDFKAGGTYARKFTTMRTGSWEFENDGGSILAIDDDGSGNLWHIVYISSGRLILSKPDSGNRYIFMAEN